MLIESEGEKKLSIEIGVGVGKNVGVGVEVEIGGVEIDNIKNSATVAATTNKPITIKNIFFDLNPVGGTLNDGFAKLADGIVGCTVLGASGGGIVLGNGFAFSVFPSST